MGVVLLADAGYRGKALSYPDTSKQVLLNSDNREAIQWLTVCWVSSLRLKSMSLSLNDIDLASRLRNILGNGLGNAEPDNMGDREGSDDDGASSTSFCFSTSCSYMSCEVPTHRSPRLSFSHVRQGSSFRLYISFSISFLILLTESVGSSTRQTIPIDFAAQPRCL